jgi:MAX dimerization protein
LGLLTKAKAFIKALEDKERKQEVQREALAREQRYLRRKLEGLLTAEGQYRVRVERSISECSTCTLSTLSNSSQEGALSSQEDEVDIMGYGSSSDTDDQHSVQSSSSDSGCVVHSPLGLSAESL